MKRYTHFYFCKFYFFLLMINNNIFTQHFRSLKVSNSISEFPSPFPLFFVILDPVYLLLLTCGNCL